MNSLLGPDGELFCITCGLLELCPCNIVSFRALQWLQLSVILDKPLKNSSSAPNKYSKLFIGCDSHPVWLTLSVNKKTSDLSTKSPAVAEVQPGSTHAHYCAVGRMSRIVYVIVYCVAGYLASRRKAEQLLQMKLTPTVMLPHKSECSHHNKGGVLGCAAMTAECVQ